MCFLNTPVLSLLCLPFKFFDIWIHVVGDTDDWLWQNYTGHQMDGSPLQEGNQSKSCDACSDLYPANFSYLRTVLLSHFIYQSPTSHRLRVLSQIENLATNSDHTQKVYQLVTGRQHFRRRYLMDRNAIPGRESDKSWNKVFIRSCLGTSINGTQTTQRCFTIVRATIIC